MALAPRADLYLPHEDREPQHAAAAVEANSNSEIATAPRVAPAPNRLPGDTDPLSPLRRACRSTASLTCHSNSSSEVTGVEIHARDYDRERRCGAGAGADSDDEDVRSGGGSDIFSGLFSRTQSMAEVGGAAADLLIPGLEMLSPLRCRAASLAFECAAHLNDSPRLPAPDATAFSASRAAGFFLLVALSLICLRYATPSNILSVVEVMRQNPGVSLALYLVVFTVGVVLMLPGMLFSVAAGAAFGFATGAAVSFAATVTGVSWVGCE